MKKNMFVQQTLERYMIPHTQHLEDGRKVEKLDVKELRVEKDSIVLETSKNILMKEKNQKKRKRSESVMQESVVTTKKKISKDKLNNSKQNIQSMKSFQTLDQDSTGKEKVLRPFWTKYSQELSRKLWLPTKTECVDLDMNSLSKSAKSLTQNSWFVTKVKQSKIQQLNYQNISFPLLQSLSPEIMDFVQEKIEKNEKKEKGVKLKMKKNLEVKMTEEEKKENPLKVKKIQIFPNQKEKETLRKWMGASRWTYNTCLDGINKGLTGKTTTGEPIKSMAALRAYCINSDSKIFQENKWLEDIPYDVRDEGMLDLLKAYKTSFAKGKKFKISFKSKKEKKDSIVIHKKHWKHKRGDYAFVKNMLFAEKLPEINHDMRLTVDKLNRYWICIPIELEIRSENQRPINKVVSIDPGVRSFSTTYDHDGMISEWGCGDDEKIQNLCIKYDKLQSKLDKNDFHYTKTGEYHKTKKTRKNFKLKMLKVRENIRNKVKDLHWKFAKFLCSNYNTILLPKFESQHMISKEDRKISSKTARSICTYSHYLFQQRLIHKSREFPWCKVVIVEEDYTSVTCGSCGKYNHKLGSSKDFNCPHCDYKADRDINASRNILLKYISEQI